jgi:hypothetical protein
MCLLARPLRGREFVRLGIRGGSYLDGLTASSFAELASRFPVAAGEAAYVRSAAFGSNVCDCDRSDGGRDRGCVGRRDQCRLRRLRRCLAIALARPH